MSEIKATLQSLIDDNQVVLFMKGSRLFPQCGFSARAVELFKRCGVTIKDVNVLSDPTIRQGIKDFSNWPTIPQAYIGGKFVGGSDILIEMYESGELQQLLGLDAEPVDATPPTITLSDKAKEALVTALADAGNDVLRFDVSPSFSYDLNLGPKRDSDFAVETNGVTIYVSPRDAGRANGSTIDYVDGSSGVGFKISNPDEPARVKNMSVRELKATFEASETVHLFDTREARERALADIPTSRALDDAGVAAVQELAKDSKIVIMCHHGVNSRQAAEQLLAQGYSNVFNLTGGVDAWAAQIDTSVPRY